MKKEIFPQYLLSIALTFSAILPALAQRRTASPVDTAYVGAYPRHLIGRLYLSQKYTNVDLLTATNAPRLKYRPNTSLNLGVGVTYGPLTLNLAYGFPFLNSDAAKGRTRYVDLQTHLYTQRWVIDLFGQFYNGYYLAPQGLAARTPDDYYQRSDARLRIFGLSGYRVFNPRRFSYRAALIQTEWQKKSAGSWLAGFELYGGSFRGDSTLVPTVLAAQYPAPFVRELRFVKIGPGGGYAYTLVVKNHYFATASLTFNLNATFSSEISEAGRTDDLTLRPNLLARFGVGYNSDRWAVSVSWVENAVSVGSTDFYYGYLIRTGNYRLTVAKRFVPGRKLRKLRRQVEEKVSDIAPKSGR
ncbi:MAG: DUF4421 domain-containing protein [Cytophagaceae bacterium]|nr:DUF4421 domain-containing protein [Cytophagaceae bacterium]